MRATTFARTAAAWVGLATGLTAIGPAVAYEAPRALPKAGSPAALERNAEGEMSIRICAGGRGGNYYPAAEVVDAFLPQGYDADAVETAGTWDNIVRTLSGECHVLIAQPDGIDLVRRTNEALAGSFLKVGDLHSEYAWAVCSRNRFDETDIGGEIEDSDYRVVLGSRDGGANVMFANWVAEDSGYGETTTVYGLSTEDGIQSVVAGQNHCIILASGINNRNLNQLDANAWRSVRIVDVDDGDFNDATNVDGERLYSFVEIPGESFQNLTKWDVDDSSGTDIETISWKAALYIYLPAFEGPEGAGAKEALRSAVRFAGPAVEAAFRVRD